MAVEHIGVEDFAGNEADVAVDVVGTDKYQIIKIALGADGAIDNMVDAGVQAAAASVPVTLSTEDVAIFTGIDSVLDNIVLGQSANLVPNSTQADQALTVDATVGGVQLAALHADTTHVEWDLQAAQVRVTFDGSAPTSTNGHLIEMGQSDTWSKAKATAAKFIRTGATSGVFHASQLKGA